MNSSERALRDLMIHGGIWLLLGWRIAIGTFVVHWGWNIWRKFKVAA